MKKINENTDEVCPSCGFSLRLGNECPICSSKNKRKKSKTMKHIKKFESFLDKDYQKRKELFKLHDYSKNRK